MKKIQLAIAVALAATTLSALSTQVRADEIQQEQDQELELHCDIGSYGQNVNCWAKGKQNQKFSAKLQEHDGKTIIIRDGRIVPIHYVVDTGLDLNSIMVAGAAITAGAGATAFKLKNKAK